MAKTSELQVPVELLQDVHDIVPEYSKNSWVTHIGQVMRFGVVGILNTFIDILTLNILLWRFPTHNPDLLLFYNSIAYLFGAINSYGLNKYWTFKHTSAMTKGEILRFAMLNILGIICNDSIIWGVASILHPFITNELLWANVSKGSAVLGTMMVSYFGMRLWVFTKHPQKHLQEQASISLAAMSFSEGHTIQSAVDTIETMETIETIKTTEPVEIVETSEKNMKLAQSISVILPAHNEEEAIAETVLTSVNALKSWTDDFEVIVVNDGSKDGTQAIVEEIARNEPRVRIITHPTNQGYGAALISGFEAISKDLAFFMDSDGQFDILDLERFFPLIEKYDAVLGYRIHRQDTWMRKLNAWGWKMLVRNVLGVRVRDVDCAFKLYRGDFFRTHKLETRGAMINT
ncbi:MAG: glycosyltransferase, partial [Chloroflexota bacterium]|nr:glycosyltransferase [Chloroflexota bacterium]